MKLISILALLLAVSCSNKTTVCTADTDCSSTQVCNATTKSCQDQSATNCRTSAICSALQQCITGACTDARRVFISSAIYASGTTKFTKDTGADAECQSLATAAGLTGKWMAWIAGGTGGTAGAAQSATDRIAKYTVKNLPYYLIDNTTKVANANADFISNTHLSPINLSETGSSVKAAQVYTGTAAANCSNWTSSKSDSNPHVIDAANQFTYGYADNKVLGLEAGTAKTYSSWQAYYGTDATGQTVYDQIPCSTTAHLYCVEID